MTVTAIPRLIITISDRALQLHIPGYWCFRDRPCSACPEQLGACPTSLRAPAPASLQVFLHPWNGASRRGMLWDVLFASTRALWTTECHEAPSRMLPQDAQSPSHTKWGSSACTYIPFPPFKGLILGRRADTRQNRARHSPPESCSRRMLGQVQAGRRGDPSLHPRGPTRLCCYLKITVNH